MACDRAIFDDQDRRLTIVDVLEGTVAYLSSEARGKGKTMLLPKPWNCITLWRANEGDPLELFWQKLDWVDPDGVILASKEFAIEMTRPGHKQRTIYNGFVLTRNGEYHVSVSARQSAEDDWIQMGKFPVHFQIKDISEMEEEAS